MPGGLKMGFAMHLICKCSCNDKTHFDLTNVYIEASQVVTSQC